MRPKPSRFPVAALAFVLLFAAGNASADLLSAIAGLSPGDHYRVAFVTSGSTAPTSSNISDYNTFAQTQADASPLTSSLNLTWKALASTYSVNARDNTGLFASDSSPVAIFNTDGQIIASSADELWSKGSSSPIKYNQYGAAHLSNVWTGTYLNGLGDSNYWLGNTTTYHMTYGYSSLNIGYGGLDYSTSLYYPTFPIYAMSNEATVPAAPAPEPSTLTLSALALVALLGGLRKRASVA